MVEGTYGSIIFGKANRRIHTFYQIDRQYKGRYGSHMVHLRKPLLEWAGNDLIQIDMRIKLNAAWCGDPLPILDEWHYFHENALAAPLIIGTKPMAPDHSLFVIVQMKEGHKHWLSHGGGGGALPSGPAGAPSRSQFLNAPNFAPVFGGRLIACELDVHFEEYIPYTEPAASVSLTGGIPGFIP